MTLKNNLQYLWDDPLFKKPFTMLKFRRILSIATSEMIGTCSYVNIGCACSVDSAILLATANPFQIAVAFAFAIGLAYSISSPISGSILNPLLSLAMVILGHFSIHRFLLYTMSQMLGASLGVGLNALLVPDLKSEYCINDHSADVTTQMIFLYEFLYSVVVCWGLCALIDKRRLPYLIYFIDVKFLIIVFPIYLNITKLYGTSTNPSKAFGAALIGLRFTDFWIYFFGPFIGSAVLAILYRLMFAPYIKEKSNV